MLLFCWMWKRCDPSIFYGCVFLTLLDLPYIATRHCFVYVYFQPQLLNYNICTRSYHGITYAHIINHSQTSHKGMLIYSDMDIKIKASQVTELEESLKNLLQENQQLIENISGLQSQIQNSAHLSTVSSTMVCNYISSLLAHYMPIIC